MQEALHDHHTSFSIGGRSICNLRFADNIDLMDDSHRELQDLANKIVERATACGTEVTPGKSKIVTKSTNNISADISLNEEVTIFKFHFT